MSQMPKWYRRRWYEHKLGLDSPNIGYADQADAQARRSAVEQKLARDDREFAQSQYKKTQSYLSKLSVIKGEKS